MNKEKNNQGCVIDMKYEMPECAFKFVYQEAIDPDYAEQLVEELK